MKNLCVEITDLQTRISDGDERAFEQVFRAFYKKLLLFSQNFVKTPEHAEEVVEDVFVKLWVRRQEINQIKNLKVYLYSATKNQALNALYKEKMLFSDSADLSDHDSPVCPNNPHDMLVNSELNEVMNRAVDALPERCKLIFKLVREDGLKYKEIAEILGISVNTIDAQMAIAVKRICESLGINKENRSFSEV